jgi:hypothetical protein
LAAASDWRVRALCATALALRAGLAAAQVGVAEPGPGSQSVRFLRVEQRERFEDDGRSERTSEIAVELRDGTAIALFGQLAAVYVEGLGEVQFDSLFIEKPDGRRSEVRSARTEDINPFGVGGAILAADLRLKRITIPGLEPGDRLSYRIVQRSRPLVPGHIFGEAKLVPLAGDPLQVYELDLPRTPEVRVTLREGLGAAWQQLPAPAERSVRRLEVRPKEPSADGKAEPTPDARASPT